MPDRYEDGVRALQTIEVPDQWAEIEARAANGLIVPLGPDNLGGRGRRRWPTLLAAAAALVLVVGGVTLALRDDDDVRTTDPTMTTTEPTPPTTGRPDTFDDEPAPETTAPDDPTPSSEAPVTPAPSEAPSDTGETVPDLTECPVDMQMTTSTPPTGWSATMTPASEWLPSDPPEGADPRLAGGFNGPTSAEFVTVSAGFLNLQDDNFERFPGPVPGVEALIAPWTDGWYLEVFVPRPAGDCWVTLQAIGMSRDDATRFVGGLAAR